ncbi:MAG: phage major tail tube protein [Cyanobacteria bacterium P01_E01_bin.42]
MSLAIAKINKGSWIVNGVPVRATSEITLPALEAKAEEGEEIALFGTPEYVAGLDVMEAEFKLSGFDKDAIAAGANIFDIQQFICLFNADVYQNGQISERASVRATLRGMAKEMSSLELSGGEFSESEFTFGVRYYKLEYGGQTLFEIDVDNNIYIVNGEDKMASIRANLGMA